MGQKSKYLLASGAVCVLALTGCGGSGGGNGGGGEESPTPVEAPDDYTLETAESTLAATEVNGEALTGVSPAGDAMEGMESEDAQSMLQMLMTMIETDPEECKDPVFGMVSAGTLDGDGLSGNLSDMVGGSGADDMTVSVRVMDSRDAADQAVSDLQSSLDGCETVTLSAMGDESELSSSTSSPDVEGAGQTLVYSGTSSTAGSTASPEEDTALSAAGMSVGNLVIMVAPGSSMSVVEGDTGTETADPASEEDLQSVLEDVASTFVDGPVESTESASPSATPTES